MKWLGLTAALLSASIALVAWVYLRDRDTTNWRPPEQQLARVDGMDALTAIGRARCRPACTAEVLGRIGPERWLVRVAERGSLQCLQIDLETFAIDPQGLAGVQPGRCPGRS